MDDKGRLLIVDDETSLLRILEQFLSEKGYRVDVAATGSEATARIESADYDVTLIDLKLPDMDGLEVVSRINSLCPATRCVIMTAFASLESTIEALRLSVYDYILKPFDLVKIGEVVDAACDDAASSRENSDLIGRLEDANRELEASRNELSRKVIETNENLMLANESLKKHVTRLKMLYQMGRDISSNENWSDALDRFLMALSRYLEAEGTALMMYSESGSVLKTRTSYNLSGEELEEGLERLLEAGRRDLLKPEIFTLESCGDGLVKTCLEATSAWRDSVVPLVYKGRWLGFLLMRKSYGDRRAFLNDYHFINTIQTILTEEVANAVNISTLRNLKDFNSTILENMGSGVIKTDRSGRVVFINRMAREMIGEVGGGDIHFDDLFPNPMGSGGLFEYLVSSERPGSSFEGSMSTGAGETIPVRINSTRIRTDEFRGDTLVAVFEDLTTRKAMEEELRRADRLRSLGELSAGVAHEIRNPLTGIATTAQVLREQLAGEPGKLKYLTVILDEIRRLDDIIRNLLSFARPAVPRPDEVDIVALVSDTVDLARNEAAGRGVEVDTVAELGDGACFIDRDQIRQVVLNLSRNAIEACESGERLVVRVLPSSDPSFFRVEFTDTGCGVPPDVEDRLYDPFFTTRAEGTGLGLSITRKIVESHGGRIFHERPSGRGARFIIEIPRKIAASKGGLENMRFSGKGA